jgi:hypothetical protein
LDTALAAEAAHGGDVVAFNDAGAVRLCSRDGLAHLHQLGWLTDAELENGLLYRMLYEMPASDLRSQLGGGVGGGGDHEAFVGARFMRAKSGEARLAIEQAVTVRCGSAHAPRYQRGLTELRVLRMVAGEGVALSALGSGGSMASLHRAALKRALAVVGDVLAGR